MKIYSSSSPSSSYSFDTPLHNSDNASAGCLSGILRRLLCGNLSSRSSNLCKKCGSEGLNAGCSLEEVTEVKTKAPGVVARLMGLESMPELCPNSIGRSRSANSVSNKWEELNKNQTHHCRVKTSLSFREIPTFLRQENEEFFLLSFKLDDDGEEPVVKTERSFRELKEKSKDKSGNKTKEIEREKRSVKKKDRRRERKVQSRKNVSERRICSRTTLRKDDNCSEKIKCSISLYRKDGNRKPVSVSKAAGSLKTTKYKENSDGAKFAKKKEDPREKNVEPECGSENSSPVSVLDLPLDADGDFVIVPRTLISEKDLRPVPSNSRRKLANDFVCSDNYPTVHRSDGELTLSDDKGNEPTKMDYNPLNRSDLWGEVCRLAAEDLQESNWNMREVRKMEDIDDIGIEFGLQILDHLLHEAIWELALLPRQISTM